MGGPGHGGDGPCASLPTTMPIRGPSSRGIMRPELAVAESLGGEGSGPLTLRTVTILVDSGSLDGRDPFISVFSVTVC